MANKYTVASIGATFVPLKNMITLYNGTGSGLILKVWKIWMLNNQSAAVTGVLSTLSLRLLTATAGGAALTPLKHNSTISNLPSQVIAAEGATNLTTSIFRRIIWSTDEPAATASSMDEVEIIPNWNVIWDTYMWQTVVEPIVLNEGQGLCLVFETSSSVGVADFFMEFTAE
jgi:chitinase